MCGIVMCGGSHLYKKDVELFEKLLFADTFRGPHSTGVFTRCETKGPYDALTRTYGKGRITYPYYKDAVDAPTFLNSIYWEGLRDNKQVVIDSLGKPSISTLKPAATYGNFYVGHNRWRTVGAINPANSHPFRHGKITMVHNGTLLDQALLPDSTKFEVDSDNVAHSLNVWGVDKTIQNLDGAFTLVWHNSETETLHIIRNEERPFHLAETDNGKWFGASEEGMLLWILGRGKAPITIKRHFEIEVGVEYVFDVDNGGFSFKEERKHELPEFLSYSYASRYGSGYSAVPNRAVSYRPGGAGQSAPKGLAGNGASGRGSVLDESHNSVDELFKSRHQDFRMGGILKFRAMDFTLYSAADKSRGRVLGMIDDAYEYIEVHSHNVQASEYSEDKELYAKIVGGYVKKGILHVITTDGTRNNPAIGWDLSEQSSSITCAACGVEMSSKGYARFKNGKQEMVCLTCFTCGGPEKETEVETKTAGGTTYTREGWDRTGKVCGNCSDPIPFEACDKVYFYNNEPICSSCEDHVINDASDQENASKIIGDDGYGSFVCLGCSETHSLAHESISPRICDQCYDWFIRPNQDADAKQIADEIEEAAPWLPLDKPDVKDLCECCGKPCTNGTYNYRSVKGKTRRVCRDCSTAPITTVLQALEEYTQEQDVEFEDKLAIECECCGGKTRGAFQTRICGKLRQVCNECFDLDFDILEDEWAKKHNVKTQPTVLTQNTAPTCQFCGKDVSTGWYIRNVGKDHYRSCEECYTYSDDSLKKEVEAPAIEPKSPLKDLGTCEVCDGECYGNTPLLRHLDGQRFVVCGNCYIADNTTLKDKLVNSVKAMFFLDGKSELKPFGVNHVGEKDNTLKQLYNGMRVTKGIYEKMNTCLCGAKVPWELATTAEMSGSSMVCPKCSEAMDNKESK